VTAAVAASYRGPELPAATRKLASRIEKGRWRVTRFLLWCILLVLCWPVALLALLAYPVVWLLVLPFRLVGIAVDGVLGLVRAVILLPARLLGAHPGR
jgi:hypothetical protein